MPAHPVPQDRAGRRGWQRAAPNAPKRTIALLRALAPDEGYNLTALPSVRILRSNRPLRARRCCTIRIVIVRQGRKRGYFGDQLYLYDERHYLAVSVPVPFNMETDASEARPLLALYLHLDFTLAAELAMQIDREGPAEPVQPPQSMMSTPMDDAMQSSVLRFLEAMHRPLEAAVLGPNLLRELYFRVLTGAQGSSMREALAMRGQFGRIGKSLRLIHAGYAQDARRDATGRGSGHERAELPQSLQGRSRRFRRCSM
jgi:hypothetical protein